MKLKILTLTESERSELTFGFRNGESHSFRMRCRCVLLKSEGLNSVQVGIQTEMTSQSVNGWVKRFEKLSNWIDKASAEPRKHGKIPLAKRRTI